MKLIQINCLLPVFTGLLSLASVCSPPPAFAAPASLTYTHEFTNGPDGSTPRSNVVVDSSGNVFGEASFGGTTDCFQTPGEGCGTVYKIDPTGVFSVLVTFQGTRNGATGYGDLALDKDTLFGEAYGNVYAMDGYAGDLLFSIKTDGSNFRVLHRFSGTDGARPFERPVVTPAHILYSVTSQGGASCSLSGSDGCGVLFQLNPDGSYVVLHNFTGLDDGAIPGRVILDSTGNLIGTTETGGSGGAGTIYSYNLASGLFTTLVPFTYANGSRPHLGDMSPNGTIYGATYSGGSADDGMLFTLIKTSGQYVMQPIFDFTYSDGAYPTSGPLVVRDGELVGTTSVGGLHSGGTLYSYRGGVFTSLHSFSPRDNAPYGPQASPGITRSGIIYGTVEYGGTALRADGFPCQCGAVFKFVR